MKTVSFALLLTALTASALAKSSKETRQITVDASRSIGQLKNLQGTNNAQVPNDNDSLDVIDDSSEYIAQQWINTSIKEVLLYTMPTAFQGYGKNGTAGDPKLNANYDWTANDKLVRRVVKHGAKASFQFQDTNGRSAAPAVMEQVAFMIGDRYMNGAHGSGFKDALHLLDFYPEADLTDFGFAPASYLPNFELFAGFARGLARADKKLLAGAWGGNRIWTPKASDVPAPVEDPYKSIFFEYCKKNKVPLGAATFHYANTQFSQDPYEVIKSTKQVRKLLVKAGLPHVPIWLTEHNRNPAGIRPTSAAAIANYDDPATFAGYVMGTAMYGQDADADQIMSWTGFGYGGYGAGNAYFEAWFTKDNKPKNAGAAWKLGGDFVTQTPKRLALDGNSPDGFAALAGSDGKGKVQVLLNNYQINYDVLREITANLTTYGDPAVNPTPEVAANGLYAGETFCLKFGNALFFIPICQTLPVPTIRNNPSTSYRLRVAKLPWGKADSYTVKVQRVGGGGPVSSMFKTWAGKGNSIDVTFPFPPNAQDLVTITKNAGGHKQQRRQ